MQPSPQFTHTALIVLLVFATSISMFLFMDQSVRLDEAQSLWQSSHDPEALLAMLSNNVHVPLYHLTLHFWQAVFGSAVEINRILSLLFYLFLIPTTYKLGEVAYNRSVGLFAAILVTISPFMNWFGSEVRMYTLFTFLTTANHLLFIMLWQRQPARIWIAYTVVSIIGIYTHYFFVFVFLTQIIFYLTHMRYFARGVFYKFLNAGIIVLLSFLPWLLYLVSGPQTIGATPELNAPTPINLFNAFANYLFGFQTDFVNTLLVSLWPLLALAGFLAVRKQRYTSPATTYFILGFLLPITITFAISVIVTPVFLSRYLIFTVVPIFLFISWILYTYPRILAPVIQIGLVLLMLTTLTVQAVSPETPTKENFRGASTYIENNATGRDMVVLSAAFIVYPFDYYYDGRASVHLIPPWNRYQGEQLPAFSADTMNEYMRTTAPHHNKIYLLLGYDQGYEEELLRYFDNHFRQINTQTFSPDLTLLTYKVPTWYNADEYAGQPPPVVY